MSDAKSFKFSIDFGMCTTIIKKDNYNILCNIIKCIATKNENSNNIVVSITYNFEDDNNRNAKFFIPIDLFMSAINYCADYNIPIIRHNIIEKSIKDKIIDSLDNNNLPKNITNSCGNDFIDSLF